MQPIGPSQRREGRLKIEIKGSDIRAADVGAILTAGDKAFARFSRSLTRVGQMELTVEAVEPGSIEFVLGAADALEVAANAVTILAPFASHIATVLDSLIKGGPGASPVDRKFVRSIVEPLAKGRATQINFVNNGTIVLTVDPDTSRQALERLDPPAVTRERSLTPPPPGPVSDTQARMLEGPGLGGTAKIVDREWYARLAGGHGVLVPLSGAVANLIDGQSYSFKGTRLTGQYGETVGVELRSAEPRGG